MLKLSYWHSKNFIYVYTMHRMPYGNTVSAMSHIPEYMINFNTTDMRECGKTHWKVEFGHLNQLDLITSVFSSWNIYILLGKYVCNLHIYV